MAPPPPTQDEPSFSDPCSAGARAAPRRLRRRWPPSGVSEKSVHRELYQWLKTKTRKDVKIVCPDPPVENHDQKMILVLGSSSEVGGTTARTFQRRRIRVKKLQDLADLISYLKEDTSF